MNEGCMVEARGACVTLGGKPVLHEVTLCVYRGEVLSVIGGSGSGKTTLLRLLLGLQAPASGSVRVLGRPPGGNVGEIRNRTGVLFQSGALFSALDVFDNVALPLRELRRLPEAAIRRLVMHKLKLVEIDADSARKMPAELSGGMVKRVALARALALNPELLFLDEPTAGLDPQRAQDFVLLVDALRRQLRLTVVMTTHDVETVIALADRVAVIADQRLAALAPLAQIVRHPHPFVHRFFLGRERHCEPAAVRDLRQRLAQMRPMAAGG